MGKNDNIIYWIVGIVLFLIVATQLPNFHFPFAITQTITCAEGVTNYYSMDGNLLDSKGSLDATNNGAIFVNGKINQAIEFNTTNYISFPSINSNLSIFMWFNNYSANSGWYYTSLPLTSTFGLGWNASVDEIVVGINVSGLSNIQACYQETVYENVSCKEYASYKFPDNQAVGCLNYSEGFFPNCSYYKWENQTTYKLQNNACQKNYYCISGYTQSQCSALIVNTTSTGTTTTTTTTTEENPTFQERLTTEIFKIGDYKITAVHMIILLIIILLLLYLIGVFKGK